jgi:hypothetical protein
MAVISSHLESLERARAAKHEFLRTAETAGGRWFTVSARFVPSHWRNALEP